LGAESPITCGLLLNRSTVQKEELMAFMFENLEVYQKAVDFAYRIIQPTRQFPKGYYCLSEKLNRAALSVSTNLAEAKIIG